MAYQKDWSMAPKYLVKKVSGEPLPEDEPVFVLRAQDQIAPGLVRLYADLFERETGRDASEIRAHADAMEKWPVKKLPD